MPKIVTWLLSRLANPNYRNELTGDMEEEYRDRQHAKQNTGRWLLRQTVFAIWDGQKAMIQSTKFLRAISIILCIFALPTIALFVGWLSNMEKPPEHLWQLLLGGEVHKILFSSDYWSLAWNESGITHLELAMFINIPSILWALVFAGLAHMLINRFKPSAYLFSLIAFMYLLLPYFFGYVVISSFEPVPHNVGPILAFMMLAPFFTLPVYASFLFKRYSKY